MFRLTIIVTLLLSAFQLKAEDMINNTKILVCGVLKGSEVLIEGEIDSEFQLLTSTHNGVMGYNFSSKDNQNFNMEFDNKGKYLITYKDKEGKEYKSKPSELLNLTVLKDLQLNFTTRGSLNAEKGLDFFCKKVKFKDYYNKIEVNDSIGSKKKSDSIEVKPSSDGEKGVQK